MLRVISRARSVIDTITVDVRAGGTGLPDQRQICGVGILRKQPSNKDQHCDETETGEKSSKTMEFIVNAVVLSTDRAHSVPPRQKNQ